SAQGRQRVQGSEGVETALKLTGGDVDADDNIAAKRSTKGSRSAPKEDRRNPAGSITPERSMTSSTVVPLAQNEVRKNGGIRVSPSKTSIQGFYKFAIQPLIAFIY